MDKDIITGFLLDEAKALCVVEPFYFTCWHHKTSFLNFYKSSWFCATKGIAGLAVQILLWTYP
jgi:hypothetical protein